MTIRRGLCLAIILALTAGRASAAEPTASFQTAKQNLLREFKRKVGGDRVTVIAALGDFPQRETAELLYKQVLTIPDPAVQKAARACLRKIADERSVREYLLEEWKRFLKKPGANPAVVETLRMLAIVAEGDEQTEFVAGLNNYLGSAGGNILLPMLQIDEFGLQSDADALRGVQTLAMAKLTETKFAYRRCVVQAAAKIKQPGAVKFLIDLLPASQGLIQFDIVDALSRITGQKFRDSHREWSEWWAANGAAFHYPTVVPPTIDFPLGNAKQATYYGIPICAKRAVFVLDTSGSMRGAPIEAAKRALLSAIDAIPDAVLFDVVMFDQSATTWKPQLVPATRPFKQEIGQTVLNRGVQLGTASNAALNAAIALDPEVIYFLSDGEPTDGTPANIIDGITTLNRARRISIHTIGVVTDRFGGAGLTQFMQPLAEQNYGRFLLVQ